MFAQIPIYNCLIVHRKWRALAVNVMRYTSQPSTFYFPEVLTEKSGKLQLLIIQHDLFTTGDPHACQPGLVANLTEEAEQGF